MQSPPGHRADSVIFTPSLSLSAAVPPPAQFRYATPFTGVPVASIAAAVCSDFRTTFAAKGFSHSNAMNAASRSQIIMAQNTFDHDPVLANSHAAPGPANAAATPLAVYTIPYFVVAHLFPYKSPVNEGNNEKILPHAKKHRPDNATNQTGRLINWSKAHTATASSMNAMKIEFSRPMLSETHPQNGRVNPFSSRSTVIAITKAVMPKATTTLSTWYDDAIGFSCAVTTKPPKASIVIIR